MKKKVMCIGMVCIMLLGMLCGCGKTVEKQILGTWYEDGDPDLYLEIYEDGTVYDNESAMNGDWHLANDDNTLVLSLLFITMNCSLEIDGDSMTLTDKDDGDVYYYTRSTGRGVEVEVTPNTAETAEEIQERMNGE